MKSFPLQTLLDLSNARMDDAARQLGQLLTSEQDVENTLAVLHKYREEYESRFRQAAQNGISRDEWGNYQSFLGRLDDAIAQQNALVDASKQRTSDGQKEWLERRNKVKAFDTLSQRHKEHEFRNEAKSEQRDQDEHAAKGFRTRDD
jgi:flagellar FliJ protein